jgi:ferric-dicitrate binding protein FerR (iron transport regulator)
MGEAPARKRLSHLIKKYLEGTASPHERAFVEKYYTHFDHEEAPSEYLTEQEKTEIETRLLDKIHTGIYTRKPSRILRMSSKTKYWAAAVALLISVGAFLYVTRIMPARTASDSLALVQDVMPGKNGAILQLAGGTTILLDTIQNGSLSHYGHAAVVKDDSVLTFTGSTANNPGTENLLTTPRGRQQQLILPDGSKVWLNAGSSIRFPSAFSKGKRLVKVSGEVYFEIAHDKNRPFLVEVDRQGDVPNGPRIEVLGTSFNINAYHDENAIKTTLLEGSVKIVQGSSTELLHPGQQAAITPGSETIQVATVDINEAVAWKNGYFQFDGDDIAGIMRKISRWYDIQVAFEQAPESRHYSGKISRNNSLSQVLKVLEISGVHFKTEDHKIIVIQ